MPSQAQYQFAADFVLFLVAVTGLALVVLRGRLLTRSRVARVALAGGLLALAAAAFLHGSLIAGDEGLVAGLRVAGVALLAAGAVRWRASRSSDAAAWLAAAALAGDAGATLAGGVEVAAGFRAAGGLLLGAGLLAASRRAIAARVAAGAAATLLLLVLVLSVGLSAILDSTVEDEAVRRLETRARVEAAQIESTLPRQAVVSAATAEEILSATGRLAPLAGTGRPDAELAASLDLIAGDLLEGFSLAVVRADGGVVAASDTFDLATLVAIAGQAAGPGPDGSEVLRRALDEQRSVGSVDVVGREALVVGVVPLVESEAGPAGRRLLGAVVAAKELDEGYLADQVRDEDLSLTLLTRTRTLAAAGGAPPPAHVLDRLAERVLTDGDPATTTTADRFVVTAPVRRQEAADAAAVMALAVAQPTTAVEEIREELFSALFIMALGGTILAILFAALVGERVGSGLRRLTGAAEAIQAGRLDTRVGVRSDDEVGVLSAAFDSMAGSVQAQTAALERAAQDEARLRNRLEAVIGGMGEALVAVDADGNVTDFNAASEELFGLPAAEAVGRPFDTVAAIRGEHGDDLAARLAGVASGAGADDPAWSATGVVEVRGGAPVDVAVTSGALVGPDGAVTGAVAVIRDLRQEREVERMKREFLSRVGHELRTPLAPIMGFAQILSHRDVPAERARDMHGIIHESAKRLQRIVELLEFFASREAGRTVLRPQPVDVRALLAGVVEARPETAHRVSRRVGRGVGAVLGDRVWLARALNELLDNAEKFSPDGGPIAVRADLVASRGAGAATVEVSVADRGIGMDEQQLARAFSEWVQGDESDTRAYGGLGLGLALVQRVVEGHGGRVEATSVPGKGSKFSIFLPAVPIEEKDATSNGAGAGGAGRSRRGRRLRAR